MNQGSCASCALRLANRSFHRQRRSILRHFRRIFDVIQHDIDMDLAVLHGEIELTLCGFSATISRLVIFAQRIGRIARISIHRQHDGRLITEHNISFLDIAVPWIAGRLRLDLRQLRIGNFNGHSSRCRMDICPHQHAIIIPLYKIGAQFIQQCRIVASRYQFIIILIQ